ncbi:MAG: type IV toxin-antitoxin system AbiEi family antitoxin domain-containing protein [Deltaproteobacteria bacterium]|nr:type IV toxin-antitoxin system AbiEi family antitoxin domain-containing protein [Deltaproteobacteria bacterium]
MKILQPSSVLAEQIARFSPGMGGVFSFSDLWNLIGLHSSDRTAKVVSRLVRDGVLFKVRRGIYVTKNADLWVLACRLKKNACVSLDSVLSKEALIGSIPQYVCAIYPGNTKAIKTPAGLIRYFKIKRDLLFGQEKGGNGIQSADREKAYLDLLYYHVKGARFVIDPLTEVDLWKLNRKKIRRYLRAYKNPKFRKFVEGLINEN